MIESYIVEYMYVWVLLAMGIICGVAPLLISVFFAPRELYGKTRETYECGMDPYGTAWNIRFDVAYYLYALIFLAFDVDVLYLFPVATAFDKVSAARGISEIMIFVGILSLAIVYAWVKGVFTWPNRRKAY